MMCGSAGSKSPRAAESRRLGTRAVVTLRIDLMGFDGLRGRDTGVGCWRKPSPSTKTGGSLYSARAEKPTFFWMRREVEAVATVEAGEWKPGGVCRLRRVSRAPSDGRIWAASSWCASRGGVGGLGGRELRRLESTAGDDILARWPALGGPRWTAKLLCLEAGEL